VSVSLAELARGGVMQDFSSSRQIRVPGRHARAEEDRPSHWAKSPL